MTALKKFLFSFTVFVVVCGLGLEWYVHYEVGRELRRVVADVDGLTLAWKDLSVSILHPAVTLGKVSGVLPSGEPFTADRLRVTAFDQRNPVPHYAAVEADGVRLDRVPGLHEWCPALARPVEGGHPCDFALDYVYDPDGHTLRIKTASVQSPELGRLEATGALTGLDLADHRPERLIGLRIARLDLRFSGGVLVEKLLDDTARSLQSSVEQVRGQVCDELDARADYAAANGNPEAEKALRSLARFVRRPGVLTVSARPDEPVPVPYFFMGRDLCDNIRLLGLSVTADDNGAHN